MLALGSQRQNRTESPHGQLVSAEEHSSAPEGKPAPQGKPAPPVSDVLRAEETMFSPVGGLFLAGRHSSLSLPHPGHLVS